MRARRKQAHCMKCGRRITAEELAASKSQYGEKAELCRSCLENLTAAARKGGPRRSFYQACFHFACEAVGTKTRVSIDGQPIATAISITLRHAPRADEWQGEVAGYELTLFDAGGQWRQLIFDCSGNVIEELLGNANKQPKIAKSREVF
jgi:hypothetical protein